MGLAMQAVTRRVTVMGLVAAGLSACVGGGGGGPVGAAQAEPVMRAVPNAGFDA